MQKGLSKREKILIMISGVMLVVYVFAKFLIIPSYERLGEAQDKNAQLVMEQESVRLEVQRMPQLKQDIDSLMSRISEEDVKYGDNSKLMNLDEQMTNLLLKNNLTPVSLKIGKPILMAAGPDSVLVAESAVKTTKSEKAASTTKAATQNTTTEKDGNSSEGTTAASAKDKETTAAEPVNTAFIYQYEVTVEVTGAQESLYSNLMNFLDEINGSSDKRVKTMSVPFTDGGKTKITFFILTNDTVVME